MRTVLVVVLDVLAEDGFEVASSEDEHAVEALAPDGAHDALADGVCPRRPDRRLDGPDSIRGEDGVEGRRELGVAVCAHQLGHRARRRFQMT